jgi:predicted ATPase
VGKLANPGISWISPKAKGTAITNEGVYGQPNAQEERKEYQLDEPDILAIKGLGQFKEFRVVSEFRNLIENWHISDFHIADARPSEEEGYAEHLSTRGDNIAQVAQFLYEYHRDRFDKILDAMKRRVPGVQKVEAKPTEDGQLVLRFQDGAFKDPFIARYVSDGTIKMFAYLVLLYDPKPFPLLAVEEPENQLYPALLPELAEEFRAYARRGGQVFISTHSPDFLNGLKLEEIYWLAKQGGFTTIQRASEKELLRNLVSEGDLPGALWKQGLFEGVESE